MVTYLSPGYPTALFAALAAELCAELAVDDTRSGPDPADDPFADGRADLGWICGASYAELTTGPSPTVTLVGVSWAPADPAAAGRPVYWSDIVVPADSPVADLDGLRDLRIGANDGASLSGFHGLRIALRRRGHDPASFADIVFTGGHHRSIDGVLAGDLDAAAVDSVVRLRREAADPSAAALRVVARLGPWPTQPLVARADLPMPQVGAVRAALLADPPRSAVASALASSGLARLVAVDRLAYQPLIDALAET